MGRVRNMHHVRVIASVLLMCIIVSVGIYGILMQSNVNDVAVAAESNYVEPYIDLDDNAASLKGSIEAAHTIKNNLSIFVEEYNKTEEGISNPAMINSVENEAAIYLTFKNEYAYYLDFNDDNGYLDKFSVVLRQIRVKPSVSGNGNIVLFVRSFNTSNYVFWNRFYLFYFHLSHLQRIGKQGF